MSKLTLPEKVLLHLYRYRHISETEDFVIPNELTQNGIAEALGISRSHASILVSNLVEDGRVVCRKGRVKGSEKNTRKVYFITPLGCDHCRKILDGTIPKENLDAAMPQNINYCCSATLWSLPKKERDLIGSFIVLRCPVSRKDFDSEIPGLLPFDDRGRLSIKPETKAWFTQRADTDTLREWHSKAADWCAERNCDPKERLYHLFRSNRRHEAIKLAHSQRFMFMDFPDM